MDQEWIKDRIAEARSKNASLPEAADIFIKELLIGQFVERMLSAAEIKEISLKLIREITPDSQKRDGEQ